MKNRNSPRTSKNHTGTVTFSKQAFGEAVGENSVQAATGDLNLAESNSQDAIVTSSRQMGDPQLAINRKKSTSGYTQKQSANMKTGPSYHQNASSSLSRHVNNKKEVTAALNSHKSGTAREILQTKANIEKMLKSKQENALMFAQKLTDDIQGYDKMGGAAENSSSLLDDDFDEKSNVQWQLSLRDKKIQGAGRAQF